MLFNATFSVDLILEDENKYCEQLYVFLNTYVNTRLIYENKEEKEDCVQETVMYVYNLSKSYSREELIDLGNIEIWIFNRSRSYISKYIQNLSTYRKATKKYKEYIEVVYNEEDNINTNFIDYSLLESIVNQYNLSEEDKFNLSLISKKSLLSLGFYDYGIEEVEGESDIVKRLSYNVVDEYIYSLVKRRVADE